MPRGDRTGPTGAGPMTGRGAGFCAGQRTPGFANPAGAWPGGGFGFRGGGRGWRHMAYATGLPGWQRFGDVAPPPPAEAEALKAQANVLKQQLDALLNRIAELEQA